MPSVTTVRVGSTNYTISGIMWGTLPAWKLVQVDGHAMTGAEFEKLPDTHRAELASHVRDYIANLNREGDAS